jgi:hypothetical protein
LSPTRVILPVYVALAIFWTWPVAAHLGSRIPHDAGDPIFNTWILWWNAQAVPLTDRWWSPPMMWPAAGTMALSEHLIGLSLFTLPFQLAGAGPIAAYNSCLVLTYALSAFFAHLLVARLTGSQVAAVCAALAFGFSPYRASQLSHLQVLAAHWMPLALLGMHGYVSTGRKVWLAVFGGAWLLQALSNGYFLLFFPLLIVFWLAWFVDWRRSARRGFALAAAWIVASLPLLPILLKYHAVHAAFGFKRSLGEVRDFSAVPASFSHAAPLFYIAAAAMLALLTLGPGGEGNGPASPWRPFTWLLWLPGFDGVRVPARFAMIGTLCLAVAAGIGAARLWVIAGRLRVPIAVLAIAGLVADGLTERIPLLSPPGRMILPETLRTSAMARAAVVELPLDNIYISVAAMYRSMFHRRPLINGYSGHFAPHYHVLSLSLARGDTSGLLALARRSPLVIVVSDPNDPGQAYRQMVESMPAIQPLGITAGGSTFLLPAQAPPRLPPFGPPLDAQVRDAGRFLLEFDLGATKGLSALTFPLRRRYDDFASHLRIELSDDGQSWREAWVGWTGSLAVDATLADPSLAPIHIPLPGERTRYVRIYPASAWMKAEVRLLAER